MRAASIPMLCILASACTPDLLGDEVADDSSGTDTDTDTGEGAELDSDGDGLSDEFEAEIGTDPFDVDTDDDTYWDGWELTEGTDPLDLDSRIYTGWWPYQPDKDSLPQADWSEASQEVGAPFPRDSYLDQHGDVVDLHDFAHYDPGTGQQSFLLIDVAAIWCSSCHVFGDWIAGANTEYDTFWPTVRQKVDEGRVWWITVIVQSASEGLPTQADARVWDDTHHNPRVPVLVDAEQNVLEHFSGGQFPHFFLLDPAMQIEFFAAEVGPSDYYPAITMIDKYL